CRITLENRHPEPMVEYYQINYTLTDVPDEAAYFHAQFRRTNPLPYKTPYTILDAVKGAGHYVGTCLAWGVNNCGWWGEGEIKFYLDGDRDFPTICGTGTEDYFGASYGLPTAFTGPYSGSTLSPDTKVGPRKWSLYRWNIMDPICFRRDVHVSIQALGWSPNGPYRPLSDDIASVAYWY